MSKIEEFSDWLSDLISTAEIDIAYDYTKPTYERGYSNGRYDAMKEVYDKLEEVFEDA